MNWLSSALRRPYTVVVIVLGLALAGLSAVFRLPKDIFPTLGVPVLYVAQPYGGMDPAQMEGYLTYYYEYHFLYITGIEHVESKSIQGAALLRLQFHPGTDMAQAMAETIGYVNRSRAFMPPGTVPPFVMRFDGGSVPVGNLVFRSDSHSVAELQDAALNRVRPLFATLPGVSAPPPFGGSARAIVVRLNPDRLRALHVAPDEVAKALASANTISPSGNIRIGNEISMVPLNSVVKNIQDLGVVPIHAGRNPPVMIRDLATIEDASDIATGFALVNGRRTVYIPVTKRADASTLDVVQRVRDNLAKFQAVLPDGMKVSYELDQSPYVTRAIEALGREGLLGAALTGLMIFLFLRDIRTVFIVIITLPLALLGAMVGLWLTGQTLNLMTLGGLALAVGVLIDEATVSVENLHTQRGLGKRLALAAYDATRETAGPRLMAMLCVVAVLVPAGLMTGAARALFLPLALTVVFAMAASYLLSTFLVPVLAIWILPETDTSATLDGKSSRAAGLYTLLTGTLVKWRWVITLGFALVVGSILSLIPPRLGTEIFPRVDNDQFQVRLRAPAGTRIERTEAYATNLLALIAQEAGGSNVDLTLGFLGVQPPSYPVNLIHLWTSGPEEAVFQVQLRHGSGIAMVPFQERLRQRVRAVMPEARVSFEPADLVSRVMSFGSPTPIEIDIGGPNLAADREYADQVYAALQKLPSLRDLQFQQALDVPTVDVTVNRERAGQLGLTVGDVSRSLVPAVASTRFTVPVYWADPASGVAYQIQVEVPQVRMNSLEEIRNLPISGEGKESQLLRNVATVRSGESPGEYDRYNMQRQLSLTANLAGVDLGTARRQVQAALKDLPIPPPKVTVQTRGQLATLAELMSSLQGGVLLSIGVIVLVLTAFFQSMKRTVVVLSTIPAVLAGVVLALAITGTTVNLQSLMGMIMAIGVAVSNAILLVAACEACRTGGLDGSRAAVAGARSRLRPILMTSLAMIGGMTPMALGLGDGAEQTIPLGRAVIGGLMASTVATLLIVPPVFALLHRKAGRDSASLDPHDVSSRHYTAPPRPA